MFGPNAIFMVIGINGREIRLPTATAQALENHWISLEQAMTANAKSSMAQSRQDVVVQTVIIFAFFGLAYLLNRCRCSAMTDPRGRTSRALIRRIKV